MRSAGLSIAVLKEYMRLYDEGDSTKEARLKLLQKEQKLLKEKIDCMEDAYQKLNYKIKLYQENKIWYIIKKRRDRNGKSKSLFYKRS